MKEGSVERRLVVGSQRDRHDRMDTSNGSTMPFVCQSMT